MKYIFKQYPNIIVISILFLIITLGILWIDVFINNMSKTYNSPSAYAEKNSDSSSFYEIIAQTDTYAICLFTSFENKEYHLLAQSDKGEWELLTNKFDYNQFSYANLKPNSDFWYIYIFEIKKTNKDIIMIIDAYLNEANKSTHNISDSQNTVFYYSPKHNTVNLPYYDTYIGSINNFNKNNYILYVNDNEYPYKEWGKLFKKY